jgi:hypothetical protein
MPEAFSNWRNASVPDITNGSTMLGKKSEIEEKLSAVSLPMSTLQVQLANYLRSPSNVWVEKIDAAFSELADAMRAGLGPDAPVEIRHLPRARPLAGDDLSETLAVVREAQDVVRIQLGGWLRNPTAGARERLADARRREEELFRIILIGPDPARKRGGPAQATSSKRRYDP